MPVDEQDLPVGDEPRDPAGDPTWDRQVGSDFDPPEPPRTEQFILEPLGEQHNAADYAAWMSSIEHIRATPGFAGRRWPTEMDLSDNLEDLRRHAEDFGTRKGFTYTVLDPADGDVIGCVYIYPSPNGVPNVRSWVRISHAHLDVALWRLVSDWLDAEWPFTTVAYADR